MKLRWIPFILLSMMVAFLSGRWFGATSQANHTEARQDIQAITQTTIAVVNADVGVTVDGETQNYSSAIIETLGDDFVLVSPAMALTGYASGVYGAIITFPSYVSERVISFNSEIPQQIRLEFQINPNLSERDFLEMYTRIMDLQVAINTTLAYTYVSSIFSQFHVAQNQVDAISQNNTAGIEALDIVQMNNFTNYLQLDDMPIIPLEPNQMVSYGHFVSVTDFARNVADMYLNSFQSATEDYLYMRQNIIQLTENFPKQEASWLEDLLNWSNISVDFGQALEVYSEIVNSYAEELDNWHASAMYWNDSLQQHQYGTVSWFYSATSWSDELEQYQTSITDWHGMAQTWNDELSQSHDGMSEWHIRAVAWNEELVEHQIITNYWHEEAVLWNDELSKYRLEITEWHEILQYWYEDSLEWHLLNVEYMYEVEYYAQSTINFVNEFLYEADNIIENIQFWHDNLEYYALRLLYYVSIYNEHASYIKSMFYEVLSWHDNLVNRVHTLENEVNDLLNNVPLTVTSIPDLSNYQYTHEASVTLSQWESDIHSVVSNFENTLRGIDFNLPSSSPNLQNPSTPITGYENGTMALSSLFSGTLRILDWDIHYLIPKSGIDIDFTLSLVDFPTADNIPKRPINNEPMSFERYSPNELQEPPQLTVEQVNELDPLTIQAPDSPPQLTTEQPDSPPQLNVEEPRMLEHLIVYQPENPLSGPPPRPDEFWNSMDYMHGQLMSFDISNYLTPNYQHQVARMLSDYELYINMMRGEINSQFNENLGMLFDIRNEYTSFLHNLRVDALAAEAHAINNLQGNISAFVNIVESNNSDTHNRLFSFANMMPLSRTPIGINQNLVRFTVAPFEFIAPQLREIILVQATGDYMSEVYETYLWVAVPILGIVLVATLISYAIPVKKSKESWHANLDI